MYVIVKLLFFEEERLLFFFFYYGGTMVSGQDERYKGCESLLYNSTPHAIFVD
jgi:hypothetical protein